MLMYMYFVFYLNVMIDFDVIKFTIYLFFGAFLKLLLLLFFIVYIVPLEVDH